MPQGPRESVLASLTMIANDDQQPVDDRLAASSLVLDATHPAPTPREQDEAVARFAAQVADVVIERLEGATK